MNTKSHRRVVAAVTVAAALTVGLSACGKPAEQGPGNAVYRIGIAQIVSHPSLDAIREGFKQCMATAGYVSGQNVTYDEQNPQGDQVALTSIANNFKGNKDLIVAITTPVAQAMAQAITNTPIVFAGVTDPVGANLVASWDAPGGNLTGTSDYPPIDDQIKLITDIKPSVKTIGIVYSSSEVNAQIQLQLATDAATKLGLTVKSAAVTNSSEVQQAAASLKGVDAFYVGNDNTVVSAVEALVQVAQQQQVPVIAADPDSVTRGAVAAYAVNQTQMGCEAAKIAVKVLQGGNPATIPVVKMADLKAPDGTDPSQAPLELTVNQGAAASQGVTIPQSVLDRASVKV
ncbi:MAG: ABC transporter substrate-binding protein [Propionibacteriaceae bacterium]|nr:ABC transporter substrate-binding protein [Propionibacteriaceae bacterium]